MENAIGAFNAPDNLKVFSMSTEIEVVIFKAKPGVDEAMLHTAALAINPRIQQLPGFIQREFGASGEGNYIDIVHWSDMDAAQAAAQLVTQIPECGKFFGMIDESSVQMLHFNSVSR